MEESVVSIPRHTHRFAGVVFDLDGTLVDTLTDIANAANSVLAQHGFPAHPVSRYRKFVGEGIRVLLSRALPPGRRDEGTLDACLATMSVEYPRHLNRTAQPYAGVPELISELRRRGWRRAVLSNKPDEFAARCLRDFFGPDSFDPILGSSPDRPRKPNPAGALEIAARWTLPPRRILYVGDSGTDMATAVNAGMFPVGVLWGYRAPRELVEAGAKRLLKEPADLLDMPGSIR
jgi:phosphoglycolate phosphatase